MGGNSRKKGPFRFFWFFMTRIRIRKRYKFEAAHQLYGHDGACSNIHGHSYRFEIELSGVPIKEAGHPKDGMVMDFSMLDRIVQERILDLLDHSLILNEADPVCKTDHWKGNDKVIVFPFQPTCENLLQECLRRILPVLPSSVQLERLVLRETANAAAEWNRNDNS